MDEKTIAEMRFREGLVELDSIVKALESNQLELEESNGVRSIEVIGEFLESGLIETEVANEDAAGGSKKRGAEKDTGEVGRGKVGTFDDFVTWAEKIGGSLSGAEAITAGEDFKHF